MRTTILPAHLTRYIRFAVTRSFIRAGSAACLLALSGAAHAQTQGPATSFNVLSFGDPAANKRAAVSSNGEIPPLDYSLVSALTTNVTQSLLSGDADVHAAAVLETGKWLFGYGMGGSIFEGRRRNVVVRSRLADLRAEGQGAGEKSGSGNDSAAFAANGVTRVGFDALDLTGRNARRNVYNVSASDFTRASRLAIHNPAGSVAVINVVGAQGMADAVPIVTGMPPKDVYFNFVSADNTSANATFAANGASGTSAASGKDSAGYLNTSLSAASLSTGNAGDPLGAFSNTGGPGGSGGSFAANGMGGGGQMGAGGINAATPPSVGVSSVLPENSSLLLLCSGLLGLLPLAWRRRPS